MQTGRHLYTIQNYGRREVGVRFQQYLDILLKKLDVSPYRKLPNVFAKMFSRYHVSDYRAVFDEYERGRVKRTAPLRTLLLDT